MKSGQAFGVDAIYALAICECEYGKGGRKERDERDGATAPLTQKTRSMPCPVEHDVTATTEGAVAHSLMPLTR